LIDWRREAVEIERKVRAFNPWPVAETRLDGEQLRIYKARADDGAPSAVEPGTIAEIRADSIVVACGRGSLAVTELQRPGRKPVAARDLINTLDLTGRRLG
jgi:methionyl-tRNA formyltransferase